MLGPLNLPERKHIFFNFSLKTENNKLELRLRENSEIVAQSLSYKEKHVSDLASAKAEISALKIEAEKNLSNFSKVKSDLKSEQIKLAHLFGRSTDNLAKISSLQAQLKIRDDVISGLEKTRQINQNLIDKEKDFVFLLKTSSQKDRRIEVLEKVLGKRKSRHNSLLNELKLKDIQMERLRLDLQHREGCITLLESEKEIILANKEAKAQKVKS